MNMPLDTGVGAGLSSQRHHVLEPYLSGKDNPAVNNIFETRVTVTIKY